MKKLKFRQHDTNIVFDCHWPRICSPNVSRSARLPDVPPASKTGALVAEHALPTEPLLPVKHAGYLPSFLHEPQSDWLPGLQVLVLTLLNAMFYFITNLLKNNYLSCLLKDILR